MAAHEQSAGLVLYRPATADDPRLYLLLDYGRHWDYPKGHIEPHETPRQAAVRELHEETGLNDATIVPGFAHQITYFFRDKKKGLVRKTVIFFLAHTAAQDITLSDEHTGHAFLPYDQALARLTFAAARQVLREAEEFLLKTPATAV